MSRLSKHNRYQKSKPAPVKALPAIGALVAKALPAIKSVVAKAGAGGAGGAGGKGEIVKNLVSKFSNKQKNNTQETAEQKDFYADQSGGDFSHLQNSKPPFAMVSPFKKNKGDDSVTVSSSVRGVSVKDTEKYDAVGGTPTVVAGSSSDPVSGKAPTAENAVTATGKINGMEISTTESETSLAQAEENKTSKVNPSTGNVVTNPSGSKSNSNTAENAIKQSEGSKKPVIGNETRTGSMHNKHYWQNVNAGKTFKRGPNKGKAKPTKYVKKNDNLWVRDRPDEEEGRITHTNPFNKPKVEKPAVTGGVKANLNKKSDIPTDMSYRPAESFGNPNAKNKWSKAGLNEMREYAEASKLEGDEAGYKHYTSIINNTRLKEGLNKTRKTDVNSSSALGNSPEMNNAALHISRSKPLSGSAKIDSNIKGNTSNVKDIKMQDVNAAENKLANSPLDPSKKLNAKAANTSITKSIAKEAGLNNLMHTRDAINGKTMQFKNDNEKAQKKSDKVIAKKEKGKITREEAVDKINKIYKTKTKTKSSPQSSSSGPSKSTKRKVEKPIIKENKIKDKNNKPKKVKRPKKAGGGKGTGIIKNGKNPLFKS